MTPIRETIARAAMSARVHETAPDVGEIIVGSEFVQSCFGEGDDDGPFFRSAYGLTIAKAVLRALDEAGMVVGATDPASEARRGLDWFERTFGVPLGDMPGREDVERVRAMISASVVE